MTESVGRNLGRYRLERLIGRGGMAEVWEARDQTLGRRVAVKIILPNLSAETRFHERFLSEARAVAALEHENVLPIYDFGDAAGEPYLVMPFLENGTLAERLERGAVTPAQAIEWIRQLAAALDAAHAAGVLHRDVKPANVMLGGGGRLLLADFGIAKSNQSADLTATGIALGTPAYMAPELARGEGATSASDRYALGVLAYELLCGRPPFVGDNALALLHQHLTTPVPAVITARPDLPDDLDPAFARILAKDPAVRPPTCAALADDIARAFGASGFAPAPITIGHRAERPIGPDDATLAAPVPHGAPTPATHAMSHPAPTISSAATGHQVPASPTKRGTGAIAAAVLGALVVFAVGWLLFQNRRQPIGAEPPGDVAANEAPAAAESREEPPEPSSAEPEASRASAERAATDSQLEAVPAPPGATKGSVSKPRVPPPAGVTAPNMPAPPLAAHGLAADTPAAATASDHPAAAGGEDHQSAASWAIPPAEAFAMFGLVADAWRRGRFGSELFTQMEQRSASMRSTTSSPGVELLGKWTAGGQALIAGDRDTARTIAAEFLALQHPPEWVTLLPARFLARHPGPPPDWQVELFWADPRNEARALVESALGATPNDRNLVLARAVVDHLDGKHDEAARQAIALEPQVRQGRPRQVVARFAGDQLLWSGDIAMAISWYKKLLIAPDRTEIGAVLRTLSQEGGPQLVARACADGFAPACEAGRSPGGPRSRRARPQP